MITQLADAYIPEVYRSMTSVNSPELTAFFTSGVAVRSPVLDTAFSGGGRTVDVPFWLDLDPTIEPNYSTDNPADIATPQKITSGVMQARKAMMNMSYAASDLVVELSASDPLQRVKNRFGTYWTRQWQRRALSVSLGVLNANIANNNGDMINNIAIEAGLSATSANLFNRAAFTGAVFTAGDQFEQFSAIVVHSVVYERMLNNNDITNVPASEGNMMIPYFLGKRIIIDDGMPVIPGATNGFKFVSIIFGSGFLGYGQDTGQTAPVPDWLHRDEQMGNGGGVATIGERKSFIIHPFGHTFTGTTVTGGYSPSNANLQLATNWTRVLERKLVPIAFLITNG